MRRIQALIVAFFYFSSFMTCSWNMLRECCASEAKVHHHENSHSDEDHHNYSHETDNGHGEHYPKGDHDNQDECKSELCCDSLITSLTVSVKQIHKIFLVEFQTFSEIQKSFVVSQPRIYQKDLSHSIRGRPLFEVIYPIRAPSLTP